MFDNFAWNVWSSDAQIYSSIALSNRPQGQTGNVRRELVYYCEWLSTGRRLVKL